MAFQIFIPSFRAAMAQRASGGSKARLELQDKVMTAKRLLFRKASDDEAYAVLKSIKDNFDYFRNIHGSLKGLKLEELKDVEPVPMHPGAVKFFKENK